jgi:thymidylate kinase
MKRTGGFLVYIAGNDGTGKTTQAERLMARLRSQGRPCRYVWLRFPQYVSLPVLALSRLLGVTRYRVIDGRRTGRWEFHRAPWLATLLLWCQVIDARIAMRRRIRPALRRGEVVILDRFVYDIVVDVASAADRPRMVTSRAAHLLYRLVAGELTFVLDAPAEALVGRRADLATDDLLPARVELYRSISEACSVARLNAREAPDELGDAIWTRVREAA